MKNPEDYQLLSNALVKKYDNRCKIMEKEVVRANKGNNLYIYIFL